MPRLARTEMPFKNLCLAIRSSDQFSTVINCSKILSGRNMKYKTWNFQVLGFCINDDACHDGINSMYFYKKCSNYILGISNFELSCLTLIQAMMICNPISRSTKKGNLYFQVIWPNLSCYYRYCSLNLVKLFADDNDADDGDDAKAIGICTVSKIFIKAISMQENIW